MKLIETSIKDCFEIQPKIIKDLRGSFVKTFYQPFLEAANLESNFVEQYYSVSKQGVLRGLHFQIPPKAHVKLVSCPFGEVIDVVADLRKKSPTFEKYEMITLSQKKGNMVYIPKGLAHGFYVVSKKAIIVCQLTTVYSPEHDSGILWDSLEIPWPNKKPILSEKDKGLPKYSQFTSPF